MVDGKRQNESAGPADQAAGIASASAPISILACGGSLPLEVARILAVAGRPANIVAIEGIADADFSGFDVTTVNLGRLGALVNALRCNGARQMLIVGHARRPDIRKLSFDWGFVRNLPAIPALMRGGDDRVLRRVAAFFEGKGFEVVGIGDVAPELLTPAGPIAGDWPAELQGSALKGLGLIHALGRFDVGQAVVMAGDAVVAIEDAAGTNAMLDRFATGMHSARQPNSEFLLVKGAKPEQDLRLDLPTVGPETVDRCQLAGIGAIALEAGRSQILSRAETIARAQANGIALGGFEAGATSSEVKPSRMRLGNQPAHAEPELVTDTANRPSRAQLRDAGLGVALFGELRRLIGAQAVIVAREHVLGVNLDEPIDAFIARIDQIDQWGDRRSRAKRNRVLVLDPGLADDAGLHAALASSRIAGIALLSMQDDPGIATTLLATARRHRLFVLETA